MPAEPRSHGVPRLPCPDGPPPPELIERAGAALAAGQLIGLPTETVYGLAARADRPESLAALRRVLGLGAERGLVWHAPAQNLEGGPGPLDFRFPAAPLARRLAGRYWPGPLTLVLQGVPAGLEGLAQQGWLALRVPAQRGLQSLLARLPFPVAIASAARGDETPATRAEQVLERFGSALALCADGGPARIGQASAVLALGPGRFEQIRPGLLELTDLRRTAGLRLAFVCTGNTCRSPMAEGLAQRLLLERLGALGPEPVRGDPAALRPPAGRLAAFGFELASMGVAASFGAPASAQAIAALAPRGIDIAGHQSQPATWERLADVDLALCLTRSHARALESLLPPGRGPRLELLDPEGRDVPDPIGGSLEEYRRCAAAIEAGLRARLDDWA
jgi:protein-tyrosine phosphatase